jgi:hypothetical protein
MADEGLRVCGAKRAGKDSSCQSPLVMANGRCRIHGGATPVGVMSANYKSGKYSKDAPTRLLAEYERAREDPQLLENREEIALMDARIQDLLLRVDTGESSVAWQRLGKALATFDAALKRSEGTEARAALNTISDILGHGAGDAHAWNEVNAQITLRLKLVESEQRRLVEESESITVEKMLLKIAHLTAAVKEQVKDPKARAAIARQFRAITDGGQGSDALEAGLPPVAPCTG